MKTVDIKGVEYKMVYNLKVLFTYEEIAGHPYDGKKSIDTYLLAYAMLLANNGGFSMTFDEFIAECDENPYIYSIFIEVMNDYAARMSAFADKKKVVSQ